MASGSTTVTEGSSASLDVPCLSGVLAASSVSLSRAKSLNSSSRLERPSEVSPEALHVQEITDYFLSSFHKVRCCDTSHDSWTQDHPFNMD